MLKVCELTVSYGEQFAVENVSFTVRDNSWLMVVGPNGAGKSTVLSAVSQGIPYKGEVLVNGRSLRRMKVAVRARIIGMLMQRHVESYGFTVHEVVQLGRYAYSHGRLCAEDRYMIDEALDKTGLADKRMQSILTLSGGELQRTFLAQVFAQDPQILLLDEPTNHLDLVYQKQTLSLIADWVAQKERAVVSVMHDLSIARLYGTEALLLNRGRVVQQGSIDEVFDCTRLKSVYEMDVYEWMRDLLSVWETKPEDAHDYAWLS